MPDISISEGLKFTENLSAGFPYSWIDYYSESHIDTADNLGDNPDGDQIVGQSFTGDGRTLNQAKFYLKKQGLITGNAVAKVYLEKHATGFGTDSLPDGDALSTSDNFDVSSLTTSYQPITFTFSNPVSLNNGSHYCITIEYSGGDGTSKFLQIGWNAVSPTHPGNMFFYTNSTWYTLWQDTCFYAISNQPPGTLAGETVSVQIGNLLRSISEGLGLGESLTVLVQVLNQINASISENLSLAEAITTKIGDLKASFSENTNFNEAEVTQIGTLLRIISETINFNENNQQIIGTLLRSFSESVNFNEATAPKIGDLLKILTENLNVAEIQTVQVSGGGAPVAPSVSENLNFAENSIQNLNALSQSIAEGITLSELLINQIGDLKTSQSEGIGFAENVAISTGLGPLSVSVQESLNLAENIVRQISSLSVSPSESLIITETVQDLIGQLKTSISEALNVAEQAGVSFNPLVSIYENIQFTESVLARIPTGLTIRQEIINAIDAQFKLMTGTGPNSVHQKIINALDIKLKTLV